MSSWGPYISQMTELCSFPINNATHTHTPCTNSQRWRTLQQPRWSLLIWNIEVVVDWEPEAETANWSRNPKTHTHFFSCLHRHPPLPPPPPPPISDASVLGLSLNLAGHHYCVQQTHAFTRVSKPTLNTASDHLDQLNRKTGMISLQIRNWPLVESE